MNLIRAVNAIGIMITLIGASRMYLEASQMYAKAVADQEAPIDELGNIFKIINKQALSNARIVIVGAGLQLLAALLDS